MSNLRQQCKARRTKKKKTDDFFQNSLYLCSGKNGMEFSIADIFSR